VHLIVQAATDATTLLAAKDNAGKTAADLAATPNLRDTLQVRSSMPQHLRSRHFALGAVHAATPAVADAGCASRNAHRGRWRRLSAAHLPYELISTLHCGSCALVDWCVSTASRSLLRRRERRGELVLTYDGRAPLCHPCCPDCDSLTWVAVKSRRTTRHRAQLPGSGRRRRRAAIASARRRTQRCTKRGPGAPSSLKHCCMKAGRCLRCSVPAMPKGVKAMARRLAPGACCMPPSNPDVMNDLACLRR